MTDTNKWKATMSSSIQHQHIFVNPNNKKPTTNSSELSEIPYTDSVHID